MSSGGEDGLFPREGREGRVDGERKQESEAERKEEIRKDSKEYFIGSVDWIFGADHTTRKLYGRGSRLFTTRFIFTRA